MATIRNLIVRISVTENTDKGIRKVTTSLRETNRELDKADKSTGRFNGTLSKLGKSSLSGLRSGLDQVAAGAKKAALGITALAFAAGGLNVAIQAGGALAPLAGGLLLIPGAALAAAAALGTLKLATHGVGDAFKAAMGSDPKKFAEALKGLSPAARGVAIELHKLAPTLTGIRLAAQQALFRPLTGQLTAMARVLAGPLKAGVRDVAGSFGLAARQVTNFARQSKTAELVRALFGQLGFAIRQMTPAIQPILKGFRALGEEGLTFLPRIGTALGQIGKRFGEWLQKMVASGQATKWINNFFATLKQLGAILKNVGGIVKSVFSAASASGSGFLGVIGQALKQLNAFLKTAAGQSALKAIFSGLGAIGKTLGPVIQALVKGIGILAAPLGRLATLVGPILTDAINALAPALAALEPGLKALFGALGQGIKALAPALKPLAQALSVAVQALAPLLPLAGALAGALGTLLANALKALAPLVGPIVSALSTSLAPILPQLAAAFGQLAAALTPLMAALGTQLAKVLVQIVPQLGQMAVTLVKGLVPAVANFVTALVPMIPQLVKFGTETLTLATKTLPQLLPGMISLATVTLNVLTALVPLIPYAIRLGQVLSGWIFIKPIIQTIGALSGAFNKLAATIAKMPANTVQSLNWFIKNVPRAFEDAWNRAYSATARIGGALLRWIGALPGTILGWFAGAGKWLYNAGRNILIGLWNGIVSISGWLARSMWNLVRSVIPDVVLRVLGIHSPSRVMMQLGGYAGQGLALGLIQSMSLVERAAGGLAAAAVPSIPALAGAGPRGVTAAAGTARSGQAGPDAKGLATAIAAALTGTAVHMDGAKVGELVGRKQGQATYLRRRTG